MIYDVLLSRPLSTDALTETLARCLGVRPADVDVADEHTDQELRDWDALVLCDTEAVTGDVSSILSIYVQESVQPQLPEAEFSAAFARAADVVVLYPSESPRPSAYWLAAPEGVVARARLYGPDDEVPHYRIDAVEAPVAQLPGTRVTRIPEAVRDLEIATPLADQFTVYARRLPAEQADVTGTPLWPARTSLGAWEMLVRHLADDWAPSGWCPAELYRERLECRDELEELGPRLHPAGRARLHEALAGLDVLFTAHTVDAPGILRPIPDNGIRAHGWWWDRLPDPLPW
ncbi:hypothetical protein BFF78_13905 [Streptomyces fodineus]|uniref:Uncharacterized protein n=1 Tax=Streptomyces fodineus TaxID=1904616 RepID=A0A1D7Y8W5_9ACTN|nr:hypothetical protein [Streptomyces fodineus]AOR32002.1 hypothetical protein BFF78_13905 [Streptomyces fodineus]